ANDISKVKGDTTSITLFDRKGRSETFEGSQALAAERVWRTVLHGVRGWGVMPPACHRVLRGPLVSASPEERHGGRRPVPSRWHPTCGGSHGRVPHLPTRDT